LPAVRVIAAAFVVLAATGRLVTADGIRLTIPAGWQRVVPAAPGAVTDPRTLLVVGTRGVRARASRCQIGAYRIPQFGAAVVVVRWSNPRLAGGPLPGRSALKRLTSVHRPSFECFAGRGAVATLELGGRAYQVNVLVGDRASPRHVAEALAVARSFELVR
jgi:hypothetical protein